MATSARLKLGIDRFIEDNERKMKVKVHLPVKAFYSLDDVKKRWRLETSDIQQFLTDGILRAHYWLPVMSVERLDRKIQGGRIVTARALQHWEGYMPIERRHFWRLFKSGQTSVYSFTVDDVCYQMPDGVDAIVVEINDVTILSAECRRFEEEHDLCAAVACRLNGSDVMADAPLFDPSFRKITFGGCEYRFGRKQAGALRLLYEGALRGEPWQNGKQILRQVESDSYSLSNLFKRKKKAIWNSLVESTIGGEFRMRKDAMRILLEQMNGRPS